MARRRRNVAACERSLAALKSTGRLEEVDAAMVGLVRHLAEILDGGEDPVVQVGWLYKSAWRDLRGAAAIGDEDELGQLIATLRTPVGDAPES
jgi:hypothetical protein